MTISTAQNTVKHRDGNVVLYKRNESDHWQARYRIKIGTRTKWFRISCKTDKLETAKDYAGERFDEHRFKKAETSGVQFSEPSRLYQQELFAVKGSPSEKPAHAAYLSWIKNWIDPFFVKVKKNIPISEIDEDVIEDWHLWCVNRTDKPRGKKAGELMTTATMASINTAFRNIMKLAKRKKWIKENDIPKLKAKGSKTVRRPYFDEDQYKKLTTFLREEWVTKETESDSIRNARLLLRDYVIFMANTGLRPGKEVDTLRWCDISEYVEHDGTKHVQVQVRTGKTGGRPVLTRPNVRSPLKRIRERNNPKSEQDFIFRLPDGHKIKELRAQFTKMLKACGLKYDNEGRARSLYSLRHTYATFRLTKDKNSYQELAKNMGTSAAMIEKHYSHVTIYHAAKQLTGTSNKKGATHEDADE